MPATTPPGLTVVDHPLVHHRMAELRDAATDTGRFAALVRQLAMLLVPEVMRTVPTEPVAVETPLETMTGARLARPVTLVPILRAGLGMLDGMRTLLPEADVGFIGLERDHDTLQPRSYYCKVPSGLDRHRVVLLDPMLATGGSAAAAADRLVEAGATDLVLACLVAAPEGVARFHAAHPAIPVVAAALDRELNEVGYILPGLGDAGDRIFGTT